MDDRCYWIWLQSALGVQSRLEEAIAYFGTARRLYEAGELEWKLAGLFTARQLEKLRSQRLTQAEEILKQCAGNGWLALTPEDPCYPKRLRAIPNFPAALYVWGRMPDLDGRVALAVVGAREASFQGRQIAQGLCKAFAQAGAVVVSGGALGIDSAAHMGALEGGGETVAFLGCGLGARYLMENQYLRESIAAHGAVVSEFPPGTPPGRTTFPVRNRLLSGVSCGTVVIEAGEKSGSLITARCALEQGRDVFAVPGPIDAAASVGCNRLIRDGAGLAASGWDILSVYHSRFPHRLHPAQMTVPEPGETPRQEESPPPAQKPEPEAPAAPELPVLDLDRNREGLTDDQLALIRVLDTETPLLTDEAAEQTGLPVRRVLSALTVLEIDGYAQRSGPRSYVRTVRLHSEKEGS